MKPTVNELLVTMKIIRERLGDLKALRSDTAIRRTFLGTSNSTDEPQYDVKKVDKKIVELQNFLALADAKIKSVNAKTEVDVEVDLNNLLSPLE